MVLICMTVKLFAMENKHNQKVKKYIISLFVIGYFVKQISYMAL